MRKHLHLSGLISSMHICAWYAFHCAGKQQGEESGEGGVEAALRAVLQKQEQQLLAERARVAALDSQVNGSHWWAVEFPQHVESEIMFRISS